MTLTQLEYIVAVADARNFSRAAERSFVSQPSLSAAVRKLEDELDVQIFERGTGEVRVTEAGLAIVDQARRVLDEAGRVKLTARQGRDPLVGPLRLGVIHTVAPYLLPDLVQGLRKLAPEMPLDIEENMTASLDPMLRGGLIDVAILALPYEAPGIETTPLYQEEFRVVVPAAHPWSRRRSVGVAALEGENLLLLPIGHCFRDQVADACREFAKPAPPGKEGNSLETLRSMVASGMGVSVLPATALVPRYASPWVKVLDFLPPRPSRRIVAATRTGFPRGAAVTAIATAIARSGLPLFPESPAAHGR